MFRFFSLLIAGTLLTSCGDKDDDDLNLSMNGDGSYESGELGNVGYDSDGYISSASLGDLTKISKEQFSDIIGDRVFFTFNSASLSREAQNTLRLQADYLMANSDFTAVIEGHCDERGTREFNLALGERRATSVKNYLINLGVNPGRITIISYGKEHPEYLGSNEAAWSKNRRSVTVIE